MAIEPEPWTPRLEASEIAFEFRQEKLQLSLTSDGFEESKGLIQEILQQAVIEDEKV